MITIIINPIIVVRDITRMITRDVKVEESYPADPVISEAFIHMCGQAQVFGVIIIIMRKMEEGEEELKEGKGGGEKVHYTLIAIIGTHWLFHLTRKMQPTNAYLSS